MSNGTLGTLWSFSLTPNVDDVIVTRHSDGSLTWDWKGGTNVVLVSRELMDQMLTDLSAYGVIRQASALANGRPDDGTPITDDEYQD